jgi:hypothetical protein
MGVFNAAAATEAARAASELAQKIAGLAERHGAIRAGINNEREAGVAVTRQGFRLDNSQKALAAAEEALGAAARTVQSEGPDAAAPRYDTAQARLEQAVAEGSGAPALFAENQRRLAELEARGQAATAKIEEGRRTFDVVDEFAESTWADIRGNGSEAQAAANRAQEHWEKARQGNSMEAQAFFAARQNLDAATQALDFVDTLVDAIVNRLKDLETARDSAKALLAEAERSLKAGQEFVQQHDPDVGKGPEASLHEAAQHLAVAQAESTQAKPDWLKLAAAATAADRLADEALAGARSEAETIAKLRDQAGRLGQIVAGEINGIAKFVNVHGDDIAPQTAGAVKALVQRFDQARALEGRAQNVEEEQRRAALEQIVAAYNGLLPETKRIAGLTQSDVQRLEQLRAEMNSALADARSAIQQAQAAAAGGRTRRGEIDRLRAVEQRFEQIRLPINGEENIARTTQEARAIAAEARDIASDINRQSRPPMGPGPIIVTGGWGGWGGSGSWSGGGSSSSGPSWGGMNRSGGSFGGGSSGGSFGGGSSGGGW